MTGKFSEKDAERCAHYARFMQHLTLAEANTIFWLLFVFVLVLMCISSLQHHKSIALTNHEKCLPTQVVQSRKHRLRLRSKRLHYLSIVSLCLVLSITCTVLECFAAFNIEYCDGEDLMQLYWGFWSILQVGSIIAILGVALQFWIVLGDVETPSWAVALGTPILVFAALGFVLKTVWENAWGKCRGKRKVSERADEERGEDESGDEEEKYENERWISHALAMISRTAVNSSDGGGSLRRTSTF